MTCAAENYPAAGYLNLGLRCYLASIGYSLPIVYLDVQSS